MGKLCGGDMVAPFTEALETVVKSYSVLRRDAESPATQSVVNMKGSQLPRQPPEPDHSVATNLANGDSGSTHVKCAKLLPEGQCGFYRQQVSGFTEQSPQKLSNPAEPSPPLAACGYYRHASNGFTDAARGEGDAHGDQGENSACTTQISSSKRPKGALTGAHRQTAQDGSTFLTEQECKEYTYNTFHCFKNRKGEKLVRGPGELKGMSFDLDSLVDCEVLLLDVVGQVLADDLVRCHVFIGACTHDIFLRNCRDCTFTIAGKQLRTRDCTDCVLYTYSMTRPVVELSSGLRFRNFNGAYPRLGAHFRRAKLDPDISKWGTIHDFSKNDATLPKPHFVIETEHDGETWEVSHPKMKGKPVNPAISGLARCQSATSVLTSSNNKKKTGNKKGFAGMGMALGRSFTFNC